MAPAAQRLNPHKDRAGAAAEVLAVFPAVPAWDAGDRIAEVAKQLIGLLIHAHHRPPWIIRSGVDGQDVLHPSGELGVAVRRDGPALLQMRTQFRFFKTRPMVE